MSPSPTNDTETAVPVAATQQAFADATSAMYRAFDGLQPRGDMLRCRHCVTDADVARLAGPAGGLDPEVVTKFVTKAGTTWGDGDDLRRVAPRALSLAADRQLRLDRGVLLNKLADAGWSSWPPAQVDAVCRFLLAEWCRLLDSAPRPGHCAHQWLRQTATVVADLDPFLAAWTQALATGAASPAVHLSVVLVNSDLRPDFPASISSLFDDGTTAEQFGDWLVAPTTAEHLAVAAENLRETVDARRLVLAVERLGRFRSARTR